MRRRLADQITHKPTLLTLHPSRGRRSVKRRGLRAALGCNGVICKRSFKNDRVHISNHITRLHGPESLTRASTASHKKMDLDFFFIHLHPRIRVHMHAHAYACARTRARAHAYMHVHAHMHVCAYLCIQVHTRACGCTYARTQVRLERQRHNDRVRS